LPFAAPATPLQGTPTGAKGLDGWPDDKFPRSIRFHVDMMESALELCRSGLAVIFAPVFIAELHNATRQKAYCLEELTIREKVAVHRDVYLVKRTGSEESPEMRVLARALRQFCR
jgi:DNA-binding transcriptional LysR family regulator